MAEKSNSLPNLASWKIFAGGSSAAPGKYSYSICDEAGTGPNGVEYHISPVSNGNGKHRGYLLTIFGLPGESGWRWVNPDGQLNANCMVELFAKPLTAAKVAAKIHLERICL